ncbi:MAG: type IV pilus twitching motility protein PilT [Gemmatimonadaceae bacterium]
MPHLDRFLNVLVTNRADALRLAADELAVLDLGGQARPVTRAPFTGAQLLTILREIAPADAMRRIEGGESASFGYKCDDGQFLARAQYTGGRLLVTIQPYGGPPSGTGGTPAAAGTPAAGVPADGKSNGATAAAGRSVSSNGSAGTSGSGHIAVTPSSDTHRLELEALLRQLVERSGSDLHLRVGEPPLIRRHGEMTRLENEAPMENERLEAMLGSIMPPRNRGEFSQANDTDFAHEMPGLARFRCNALRDRMGAAAVFRVIPATVVSVEQMGISEEVRKLCFLTKGLVLVTGPTGSGKSTTLCALVDLVNRSRNDHVITIEDPIEFVHPSKNCLITQRQVGVHTTSFKSALRAALREDPDIILVGELRDLETVSIAIETAETGHLVFGTLHTTTAASTIDRLIDQFPSDRQGQIRMMLSESLKGVISQTLCKKIGGGRVAAREILLSNPAVANLIREAKTFQIPSIMQTSRKLGMVTLNDALIELVDGKLAEPQEAYTKAVDKSLFATMLRQRGHDVTFLDGPDARAPERPDAARPAPRMAGAGR